MQRKDASGRPDKTKEKSKGDHQPLRVVVLALAKGEGHDILDDFQYCLVVGIIRRLADFGNRAATVDLEIRAIGKFWELRLKGSFLKRINLRIYFAHVGERKEIVVLKAYKKEEDRQVSPHILITLEDRLEDYLAGALQQGVSVYEKGEEAEG